MAQLSNSLKTSKTLNNAVQNNNLQGTEQANARSWAPHPPQQSMEACSYASPPIQRQIKPEQQSDAQGNTQTNQTGMPEQLKLGMERLSGYSMDDVKVHYNSSKPSQIGAHAFAQGNEIHLGNGQEKHLAHEAWHVVQQKQNRVKSTMQHSSGLPVNDDSQLEREADVMGEQAMACPLKPGNQVLQKKSHQGQGIVQGQWWKLFGGKPNLYARNTYFQRYMMPFWHSAMFNKFYNPWAQFMFGRSNVVRGMELPELYDLMETGMLQSKAMKNAVKNPRNMGVYGDAGRKQHLNQSESPSSQYVSTIRPEQFAEAGNHFGSFNVLMEVVNRLVDMESSEPQRLVEGGTSAKVLKVFKPGNNVTPMSEREIQQLLQQFKNRYRK